MKKSYQEHCKSIAQEFREDIENYETKAKLATDKMYKNREPLSRADLELHKDCENILANYCSENDLDIEDFNTDQIVLNF